MRELAKVGICLALAEIALRVVGVDPSFHLATPHPAVIGDPLLGWRYKPGRYTMRDEFSKEPRGISYTFLEDGSRSVGDSGAGPTVALLGCSFMDGYGLDDSESIGWRLQKNLPNHKVASLAVRGYGTYSSLLVMRRVSQGSSHTGPITFVYGFADFHAIRNIKNPLFQRTFSQDGAGEKERGAYPVCDDSRCFSWSGTRASQWWMRSRVLKLVTQGWESIWFLWHQPLAQRVTERLLIAMRDEARLAGNRLVVAPVTPLSSAWSSFFADHGFDVVSCVPAEQGTTPLLLPDGHPNALWSERFSECLARYVAR